MKLTVQMDRQSYPIHIENNLLQKADNYIAEVFSGKRVMIISDDNVYPLYGSALYTLLSRRYTCFHLILRHGEATKSFHSLPDVYTALCNAKITRSDLIIALGGGVIGDLAGFAAATYLRGVDLIQIPTSLLAQVDSSVGGKTAVDLPQGKNLAGAFCQPKQVLIDPTVLDTLPRRFVNDGMGEVVKYGCIKDADLFHLLEYHASFDSLKKEMPAIIARCVDIKRSVVEEDPFDAGGRMLLNFGHTLGHAIEQYRHYERESHGEAVAIGMYQITLMSEAQCLTAPGAAASILSVLTAYGLPHECHISLPLLMDTVLLDKKNLDGHLNLILLHEIGKGYIHPTTVDFFQTGIDNI